MVSAHGNNLLTKRFDDSNPTLERSENPLKIEPQRGSCYEAAGEESKVLLEERATHVTRAYAAVGAESSVLLWARVQWR